MKRQGILIIGLLLLLTACKGPSSPMAGEAPVAETEDAGSQEQEDASTQGPESQDITQGYEGLLEQAGWGRKACHLEDVESLLQGRGLDYENHGNVSGERVDMTWGDGTKLMFLAVTDDMGHPRGMELMMADGQFNDSGFQENYLNQYDVTRDEEYYPQTAKRPLKEDELKNMNQTDLSIARNEIFARHGRMFEDPFLQAVFKRKTWYEPRYDGAQFVSLQPELLNEYEKANLKKMVEYEESKGYRAAKG